MNSVNKILIGVLYCALFSAIAYMATHEYKGCSHSENSREYLVRHHGGLSQLEIDSLNFLTEQQVEVMQSILAAEYIEEGFAAVDYFDRDACFEEYLKQPEWWDGVFTKKGI